MLSFKGLILSLSEQESFTGSDATPVALENRPLKPRLWLKAQEGRMRQVLAFR
jgi:hypothetical protein